jgi:hypothetical protein
LPDRLDREKKSEKSLAARNDPLGRESFRQPVIPPAPLTGDAGRGCGDASRAPNFLLKLLGNLISGALLTLAHATALGGSRSFSRLAIRAGD